jgi:homoserine acetyltransferase
VIIDIEQYLALHLLTGNSSDPENMLAMLYTWQSGDVSKQEPYNGDFEAAMKGIKAKTLVLPAKTDLYFREFGLERRKADSEVLTHLCSS